MQQCLSYLFALSDRIGKRYDPVKIFYYNYWIYVFSGFWSYNSSVRWKAFLYKRYQQILIPIYTVSVILFLVDAIIVRNDFDKLSFNLSSSVLLYMKVIEFIILLRRKENIVSMHEHLDHHLYLSTVGQSEDDSLIFRKTAKKTIRITITFYGLLLIGLAFRMYADTGLDKRTYLIPLPFKEKLEPYFFYVYIQQFLASFHFMASTLAFDLLQFTLMLRFIAHYEILEKNILKIKTFYPKTKFELHVPGYSENSPQQCPRSRCVWILEAHQWQKLPRTSTDKNHKRTSAVKSNEKEKDGEKKVFQILKEHIIHHQKLCIEIETFSNTYSRILLIQLGGMLLLIGILTLQIIFLSNESLSPLFMQQILFALTATLNIMFLSSLANELTDKSVSVANALYDTPWYEMKVNNRRTLCLILQKLLRPPKLKGGRMYNIDRPMCLKFFQFSYNMVALLKNKA